MRFADTNIFLRYLVQPVTVADQSRSEACRALIERVEEGGEEITTSEAVLAEIVYVLGSPRQYGLVPADIVARLKPIIALPGLKIAQKRLYLRALDIYASQPPLDFEDAITAAIVERMEPSELYSYDTDFDRVPDVTRIEPSTT
ncbi:MAG TPA: type II toxin-antitoxin system VapC family toxin [Thermomicrobiales bacterium]|nr:type II toxin-antitoxin system VapC family toxin [Thermomicrobiales bacterium]